MRKACCLAYVAHSFLGLAACVLTCAHCLHHGASDSSSCVAMERKGLEVPDDMFDSNCITPGTEFMAKLNVHLAYYVRKKIKEDVRWREVCRGNICICFSLHSNSSPSLAQIQVIYSGHDVPGEGEHKIMDYIRGLKNEVRLLHELSLRSLVSNGR